MYCLALEEQGSVALFANKSAISPTADFKVKTVFCRCKPACEGERSSAAL
ncbi:hypothetical protein PTUN_b0159 [Pseudoalteromonas tunicata]|nr:hypothetical protein PTUN_b0159 [Pseudoalteromonas tunicata]